MSKLAPTYDEIQIAVGRMCKELDFETDVDVIVGVARGGLLPAVIASHALDVPLIPVSYSSKRGNGDDKNHNNVLPDIKQHTILLVDDIADTGNTLVEIENHYSNLGHRVLTMVLHYKYSKHTKFYPDYYWHTLTEDEGWVTYPFER